MPLSIETLQTNTQKWKHVEIQEWKEDCWLGSFAHKFLLANYKQQIYSTLIDPYI